MLKSGIVALVSFCTARPVWIFVVALILGAGSATYAAQHFALKTDVNDLISQNLPWVQRAAQFRKNFPQQQIVVVVDAPTSEQVEQASAKLLVALHQRPDLFLAASEPGSGRFFEQNGLLFLPDAEVARITGQLSGADTFIATLAGDPSLRGALNALSLALTGVQYGLIKLDSLAPPMNMASDMIDAVVVDRPASFSWRAVAYGRPPAVGDLRRFILVQPRLDYDALRPGHEATQAISTIASDLNLSSTYQASVRQTGEIPMDDDEFGTITNSAGLTTALSIALVVGILWLALRSFRIIAAVMVTLVFGLAVSAAAGLLLVGAFNLISISFFVLFVGLGVDFALKAGTPLALAAVAIVVGFVSFMPTDYVGLSELGEIAGIGMIVAFISSITLLPAMLALFNPPGEPRPMGFAWLAPVDRFTARHRIPIVAITILMVLLGTPLLANLPFDFNPTHLQDPDDKSVRTFLEVKSDPQAGANAIEIEAPDLQSADHLARQLATIPQVSQATTLSSFIPQDQQEKIKLIRAAAQTLRPSLEPQKSQTAATDPQDIDSLNKTADGLLKAAGNNQGAGTDAARTLAARLSKLAAADPMARMRAQTAVATPLRYDLDQLRVEFDPQDVTIASIPEDISRQWITPDGRARVEVLPHGDPENTETLRTFVTAVLNIAPDATGPAVQLYEAGRTVVRAFIVAGIFALSAITVLLLITLRRVGDVVLTLVPLLVAGAVTLELCALFGLQLNFANIIALPLLLGVGVAFKIYYIVAWRSGKTNLLQSSLTRAVTFSALTTAAAFGSLWLSGNPGTSSMGKMMALALLCTMAAAVLFQPVLMGPPRKIPDSPSGADVPRA
jgi:uncharacterized protein